MTDARELLSDDLMHQIEASARTQKRQPSDVLKEAVTQYLERQSWADFVKRNERRALELGITGDDVPRLIEEYRRENRGR